MNKIGYIAGGIAFLLALSFGEMLFGQQIEPVKQVQQESQLQQGGQMPQGVQREHELPKSQEQSPQVKSTAVSKDSILIGDQVLWSTRFELAESDSLEIFPYVGVLERDTVGKRIEIISDFKLDTLSVKKGIKELEAKILLTSFDSGSHKLPQPLFIVNPHTEDTYALIFDTPVLEVNTIQVDTTGFVPMDIKGQVRYPVTVGEVIPWVLLGIFIVAAAYILYRYIKYKRDNRDFFGRPIVQDPPHIVALRELDKLYSQKLWQSGKEKLFYTGITDTLREYIEKRYRFGAMEKTSSEIMESLASQNIESRLYGELDELFKVADLVKFAKYSPSAGENEEAIPRAVRFVNSTFMQELEEEKEAK